MKHVRSETGHRRLGAVTALGLVASALVALPVTATAQEAPAGLRTVQFSVGGLQPLQPARVMDTRTTGRTVDGREQQSGALGAGEARLLTLGGRGGVPAVGAGAAWLNVTVTNPVGPGHVTVFPAGAGRPNASNLNFVSGQTVPNLVLAKLGKQGQVALSSSTAAHVIVDVVGWVPEGPDVQPLQPARVLDTRATGRTVDAQHQAGGPVAAGQSRRLPVVGRAGVPATGVSAVVLNLTATGPTTAGHVTAYPAGATRPNASTLNFAARQTVPNLVVAKIGTAGSVDLFNVSGTTHLIADVVGWIPDTSSYGSLQPARLLDSRATGVTADGESMAGGALTGGEVRRLPVTGRAGVPSSGVGAVMLNLTATGASHGSHLTVFPTGAAKPNASNLNFGSGTTRANLVAAKVGSDGSVSIANAAGSVHVIADVVGWFPSGTSTTPSGGGSGTVRMVLPDTTELAGAGDVLSLSGTAAAPTSLRLAPSADVPPVGGHLVVMPSSVVPDGTLVAVTAASPQPDGSVVLAVQRAAVPDAFVDLEIDYEGPMVLVDRPAVGPSLRTPSSVEASRDFGFGPMSQAGFSCTGDGGATVSFDAGFRSSAAEISYDLSERYLRFLVTTTPTVQAGMTASSTVTCTRSLDLPGKLPLGPTGLSLSAELDLTATVDGTITASATVATPLALGFEYRAGAVTNLSGASYGGSARFGEQDTAVTLTVTPAVEFDLEFLGAVEMGLALGLPVTGSATGGTPCSAAVSVGATLGASAELELPWLPDVEKDLGSYDLGAQEVWSGPCGEPEPVPGSRSASLSLSYDQPQASETVDSVKKEISQEMSIGVTYPTIAVTTGGTYYSINATSNDVQLDASVPTASHTRTEIDISETYAHCDSRLSGFREAGRVVLPTFPDNEYDTWWWVAHVATSDQRSLDQARPGETVYVSVEAGLLGVGTSTSTGEGCPEGGSSQEYIEETFLRPMASSDTETNCSAGAVHFEGFANECAITAVVQPDGSLSVQRTVQTREIPIWFANSVPVTYSFDLRIGAASTG